MGQLQSLGWGTGPCPRGTLALLARALSCSSSVKVAVPRAAGASRVLVQNPCSGPGPHSGEAWSSTWGPQSAGTRIPAAISFFGGESQLIILTPCLPSRSKTDPSNLFCKSPLTIKYKNVRWGLPCWSTVKTLCFHGRGRGSMPGQGTKTLCAMRHGQRKKK